MIGAGGGAFTAISAAMAVPAVHSATRPTVASRSLFIMLSPCRPLLIVRTAACCTAIIPQLPAETLRARAQTPRAIMATLKTFRTRHRHEHQDMLPISPDRAWHRGRQPRRFGLALSRTECRSWESAVAAKRD